MQAAGHEIPASASNNWQAALRAAAQPLPSWKKESVIAALRNFADTHGRAPHSDELGPTHGLPSRDTIRRHCGSLATGFRTAGLKPSRSYHRSRPATIESIRAFTREHGHAPTTREWKTHCERELDQPSASSVARLFGSWTDALVAAGVRTRRPEWDQQRILAAMRAWTAKHGRAPTQQDWMKRDPAGQRPSYKVVALRFENWTTALEAAGVLPATQRRWDHAGAIQALHTFARTHGRAPTYTEWNRSAPDHPSAITVRRLFGSWSTALTTAGLNAHQTSGNQ